MGRENERVWDEFCRASDVTFAATGKSKVRREFLAEYPRWRGYGHICTQIAGDFGLGLKIKERNGWIFCSYSIEFEGDERDIDLAVKVIRLIMEGLDANQLRERA
jgi:hypothetical protein